MTYSRLLHCSGGPSMHFEASRTTTSSTLYSSSPTCRTYQKHSHITRHVGNYDNIQRDYGSYEKCDKKFKNQKFLTRWSPCSASKTLAAWRTWVRRCGSWSGRRSSSSKRPSSPWTSCFLHFRQHCLWIAVVKKNHWPHWSDLTVDSIARHQPSCIMCWVLLR